MLTAPVDDFEVEVEILKKNSEFMSFLKELSAEEATISLKSLRNRIFSKHRSFDYFFGL